jgi:hypothetical protein
MQCTAWGKLTLSESGAATARLPLAHHCADVAAVAEALLRKGAISRRLARLAGLSCLPPELIRALVRTAFLHDLGKCNRGFQAKAIPKADRDRLGIYTAGHVAGNRASAESQPPAPPGGAFHSPGAEALPQSPSARTPASACGGIAPRRPAEGGKPTRCFDPERNGSLAIWRRVRPYGGGA